MHDETANQPAALPEGWVVALGELPDDRRDGVGGKATNLGRMIRAGLPVPAGFCVTVAAFRSWIHACADAGPLIARLEACPDGAAGALRQTAARLRQALAASPLPTLLERAVATAADPGRFGSAWAVRSSATVEDLPHASFAGQYDTILDVRGRDALLDAVRQCWLSLFSERAVCYRRKHGIPQNSAAMAVVVQEMVPAELAGVLFTADPLTGATDRLVVEFAAGPGQALVQGTIQPGRTVVKKESRRVVEASPDDSGADLPRPTLDQLLSLSRRTEELFGSPQDIEWVWHGGQVWVLQSRPITTSGSVAAAAGTSVWSNMNVAENLPNVATPMTWSFLDTCFHRIGDSLFRGFGIDPERQPAVTLVAGRVYMNVTTVRQILSAFPGGERVSSAWLFGGYQDGTPSADPMAPPRGHPSARAYPPRLRPGLLLRVVARRTTWRGRRRYLKHLTRTLNRFTEVDCRGLSDVGLGVHFRRIVDYGLVQLRVPWMLGPGLAFGLALRRFTGKWLNDADGALSARLLSRAGGMASADSALDLWRLAVWISSQPSLREKGLEAGDFASLEETMTRTVDGRVFLERWRGFMAQHGHRTRGEVDIAIPRWSERPDEVLGMLRHCLRNVGQPDPLQLLEDRSRQRERLLAECRNRLRPPLRRWMLGFLVQQAQDGLVFRENLKNELVRVVAYLRRLLLEMGGRLTRSGVLDRREDLFFFTLEELGPVWTGRADFDARSVVRARREVYRANEALSPPPVVVGSFDPARHRPPPFDPQATVLAGLAVSAGVVVGPARVILQTDPDARVLPGEILVAPHTDPGWTPHFLTAAGLVTDLGGQLSHGSVIAREYGLPAVVNVRFATRLIRTGQRICVDGDRGRVVILG